jgi:hypothetical protein
MFVIKTNRKFIFHPDEAHICARLNLTVLYTHFLGFEKISSFSSTPKGSLWFNRKMFVNGENKRKSIFNPFEAHILSWLDISVLYISF